MKTDGSSELRGPLPFSTVRCAQCRGMWFVPHLRQGDAHVCKECHHRFIVGDTSEARVTKAHTDCNRSTIRSGGVSVNT